MKACSSPCNECPFRKDSLPGWLANYSPMELHRIVMNELPFPCHMTHHKDLTWEQAEKATLCAGALRYMKKGAKQPRRKDLAILVNKLLPADLENILSISEFFEHHKSLV